MADWVRVQDGLPEITDKYLVRKKPTKEDKYPTIFSAIFIRADGIERWCININGTYWEIKGVYEWQYITAPSDERGL